RRRAEAAAREGQQGGRRQGQGRPGGRRRHGDRQVRRSTADGRPSHRGGRPFALSTGGTAGVVGDSRGSLVSRVTIRLRPALMDSKFNLTPSISRISRYGS